MPRFQLDEDAPILVEFLPTAPIDNPAALVRTDQVERSAEAINSAMNTLRNMAQLVVETLDTLDDQPSQVEVEFGLKLDAEGQAAIARSADSAMLTVRMTWDPSLRPNRWQAPTAEQYGYDDEGYRVGGEYPYSGYGYEDDEGDDEWF
ncbi:CU044_2847 family protein [Almyronema epifaneia]|uniref:CU044_2847 family protein n=1 Tax=Almyronema epifaneia S1 TaxID=2991925 RepID=A0ABW6IAH3_9CYAN